jgi:cell division protein FtsB
MRVTTQMLNESSQRAGLPVNGVSLLNYINNNSSTTTNSLLNALSKKTDSTQKTVYEQLDNSATKLEDAIAILASEKDDNIFAKAREDGDNEAIKEQVETLISDYNDMVKKLGTSGSTVNSYYRQTLREVFENNEDKLSSIGITADKNGYLNLDESKFDEADIDTLETVLGQNSSFIQKTNYIVGRVENNAQTYLESLSSTYSSSGVSLSSYISSNYNSWG